MELTGRTKKYYIIFAVACIVIGLAWVITGTVLYFSSVNNNKLNEEPPQCDEKCSTTSTEPPDIDDGEKLLRHTALWGYRCEDDKCAKIRLTPENNETALSLSVCRISCNPEGVGTLWPLPTGSIKITKNFIKINQSEISYEVVGFNDGMETWQLAEKRFEEMIARKVPEGYFVDNSGKQLHVKIEVVDDSKDFNYDTDERYSLEIISDSTNSMTAIIKATNFYGARHGLETLSQLIIFDEIRQEILIVSEAEISDAPKFKHRGISLDTSRNFIPVESLKRIINGLAMVKMNRFHWHISDSHAFPLLLKSHPELALGSAYSMDKIYKPEDVIDIVKYAKIRGVRVIPEIDTPGHIGEGWFNLGLTSCFSSKKSQPCKGAHPCGQLDPSKNEVYDVLQDVYQEVFEYFDNPDVFHMGGDEVFFECWNISQSLQQWMIEKDWTLDTEGFMELWGYFQRNAAARIDEVSQQKVPIVLWSSTLTLLPYLTKYLDKDRYIIQPWTKGDAPEVKALLENGYRIIMSNYDALYLDCGFGSWVRDGNNWCSPYIGWQKFYDNSLREIAGEFIDQVYGAEAALWVEQVDEWSLDSRIFPRTSALAERLWTDPETKFRDAEARMLFHRSQLVLVGGLRAEKLQPEWCLQNEAICPM